MYILAISIISIYQSDITFRRKAFISLQNTFQGFMSLHLNKMLTYFDMSQINVINYLSKHEINRIVKQVLQTINDTIPEI